MNISNYKNLKDLKIDKTKPPHKRLKQYVSDVQNPYTVRVDDILVQIEFSGKKSFSEALDAAFQM